MSRLIVKSHRPVQWSISVVLLSMLVALLTWLLLDKRHWSVIYDRIAASQNYERLLQVNRELEHENSRLREQVLMMERNADLDRQTAALMQEEIKQSQDEIYRLTGELEFYQGIMDATRSAQGLNIHGIHVDSLPQKHSYRLKLVLTHVTKSVKVAAGLLDVSIEGVQNGSTNLLRLQDITLDDSLELSFKFRNFKRFESSLELPEDFTPHKVLVQLQPNDRKQAKIKRVFDWPVST